MLEKYHHQLEQFGLSTNEASVYLALLSAGAKTASEIANLAKLNRSTTYVQLTALMTYGLVSTYKQQKKTFFLGESPENLKHLLDDQQAKIELQKQNIASLLPELIAAHSASGNKPTVRTFNGKNGLVTMREEIIASGVTVSYVATQYDYFEKVFTKEEMSDFSSRRAAAGITSHVLYTKTKGKDIKVFKPQRVKRLDYEKFPFAAEVHVYGDNVAITSMENGITGVIISSPSVSSTIRSLFKIIWETN